MHIRDTEIRHWLLERMEPTRNRPAFDIKQEAADHLQAQRGRAVRDVPPQELRRPEAVLARGGRDADPAAGRDHRAGRRRRASGRSSWACRTAGRLNVLANILDKPYGMIFNEFEDNHLPETVGGDGDVKYHLGFSADHVTADKHTVHLSLTPNPSHLEAVDPVVEGRMRAKQRRFQDTRPPAGRAAPDPRRRRVRGPGARGRDANLSQLPGYRTGGTIHIIVNNQIGFTTAPSDGRSTRYCTDVAKMIEVPIFHVNGEDPEAVVFVAELALDFRQTFGKDVVIDMFCYRRHGHNEGDEPAFTQPLMYEKIKNRISIRELYTEQLVMAGELSSEEAETIAETFADKLQEVLEEVQRGAVEPPAAAAASRGRGPGLTPHYSFAPVETGRRLRDAARRSPKAGHACPPGFTVNPKLGQAPRGPRQGDGRRRARSTGRSPRCWPSARCSGRTPRSA